MWTKISSIIVATLLCVTGAEAFQQRITPYEAGVVAEMRSTLNYQSTWGITDRHDIVSTTGSATADLENGFISLETGTTTGSDAYIRTVEYGRYYPGRRAVLGVGIVPDKMPTGDGFVRYGGYTDSNGVFATQYADRLCVTYRSPNQTPNDDEVCQKNFNGNPRPDGFDPSTDGHIFIAYINWYGIGGARYVMLYQTGEGLRMWFMHYEGPTTGQAMEDPNLPLRIEANNGTTAENVEVKFGGRRYDVEGSNEAEPRQSGDYTYDAIVTADGSLYTLVCLRREPTFPDDIRENTVSIKAEGLGVSSTEDLMVWIVIDPDLTTPTWDVPSRHVDSETAIESFVGTQAITTFDSVTGPYQVSTTGTGSNQLGGLDEKLDIEFPTTSPVCLAAENMSGTDATVTATFRTREDW